MKKALFCISIFSLSFMLSCKKDSKDSSSTSGNPTTENLNWVALNHEWKYTVTGTDSAGNDTTMTNGVIFKLDQDLGGGKFRNIWQFWGEGKDTTYWVKENNTHLYEMDSLNGVVKELFYKTGLKAGDTFGTDANFSEVISVSEAVSVPVGNFTCVKIKNYNKSTPSKYLVLYIDKASGPIKFEQTDPTGTEGGNFTAKLSSKNF